MSTRTKARIAIATCDNLPGWEIDDQPFLEHLERYADVSMCSWSDGSIDWSRYDCVLIRTTWDYSERIAQFRTWIEHVSSQTRVFNDPTWIRWNSDKHYLKDLEAQGVHIAPTQWLSKESNPRLEQCVKTLPTVNRWFLKPAIGASSSNTLRFAITEMESAQSFVDDLIDDHTFMLQPYLHSVESFGEVSLLFIGGELTHSVRKVPVPGDYRVQDDYGAHDEPYEPDDSLLAFGQKALLRAQSLLPDSPSLLYARLDFLRDLEGRFALNELELIEPSLFFRHGPGAAEALVTHLIARLTA